jgi:arylsulfatase A-like enzyme
MFVKNSNVLKNSILSGIVAATLIGSFIIPYLLNNNIIFVQAQAPTAGTTADSMPNILAIMGDDLGFSDLGAFGSEISTPNLDALAKDGKILTNYHTMPTCSTARASFLTGVDNHIAGIGTMYEFIAPNQVGKPGYETYLNDRVVTVAELLRDAGYHTLMSGKWHLSGSPIQNGTTPYDRGFEDVFALLGSGTHHFNGGPYYAGGNPVFMRNDTIVPRPDNTTYSNDLYTNVMIEQIKKVHSDGKPFFGHLAFQAAHSPFQAPQDYINKYEEVYDVGYDVIREHRFEKQKELGIWPANMTLPERLPHSLSWDSLDPQTQAYRAKTLAVRAAMIENMDYNIGKVIALLKELGIYDNTLISFASDNGSSEARPMSTLAVQGQSLAQSRAFVDEYNNTLANLGNRDSLINHAEWGTILSVSPFSWFKGTQGEGGIRSPFIIKEPLASSTTTSSTANTTNNSTTTNQTHPNVIDVFVHVTDVTPTFLDYAGVQHPSTYHGREVHPLMGKSWKPLLEGNVAQVYADDEPVAQELFNSTAVFMGPWKAEKLFGPPISDGEWHLYNIKLDLGENTDLASQYPDIFQKMITAYDKFAKDNGVIPPEAPLPQGGEETALSVD